MSGVKDSGSVLYKFKWMQIRKIFTDAQLQEDRDVLDLEADGQGNADVGSKAVQLFYYKVVENNCVPEEVVNIKIGLASIYRRSFDWTGEWKVLNCGETEGNLVSSIIVCDGMKSCKRRKKSIGYKRAFHFQYSYMVKLWNCLKQLGEDSIKACEVMATRPFSHRCGCALMSL